VSFGNGVTEMMDPPSGCYFVPGAQASEKHICGNTPLPGKEENLDITDKCKISVP